MRDYCNPYHIDTAAPLGGPRTPEQDAQNAAVMAEETAGTLSLAELLAQDEQHSTRARKL